MHPYCACGRRATRTSIFDDTPYCDDCYHDGPPADTPDETRRLRTELADLHDEIDHLATTNDALLGFVDTIDTALRNLLRDLNPTTDDDITTRLTTAIPYGLTDPTILTDAATEIANLRTDLAAARSALRIALTINP